MWLVRQRFPQMAEAQQPARLKFSFISINRVSRRQTGSYHQVGARRRAMDSRRRSPASELPRCVRGGSEAIGNWAVFFPGIFNGLKLQK